MTYPVYSRLFIDAAGRNLPGVRVPDSCIESAEYIIQCVALGQRFPWQPDQERNPHVIGIFGAGRKVDVTAEEGFHNRVDGWSGFRFGSRPVTVGEGLIAVNNVGQDLTYNMHCAAVVAVAATGELLVSRMLEPFNKPVTEKALVTMTTTPQTFLEDTFGAGANYYVLGILVPQ